LRRRCGSEICEAVGAIVDEEWEAVLAAGRSERTETASELPARVGEAILSTYPKWDKRAGSGAVRGVHAARVPQSKDRDAAADRLAVHQLRCGATVRARRRQPALPLTDTTTSGGRER